MTSDTAPGTQPGLSSGPVTGRHPFFGLGLAACAALLLSPDTLFMRWSEMDGFAMLAWRGLLTALVLLGVFVLFTRERRAALRAATGAVGLTVIATQTVNTTLFSLSVSIAPVSVVLFGVATTPIWAAVFGRFILHEPTRKTTWITIFAVMTGIGIAVLTGPDGRPALSAPVMLGALGGLTVGASLALTFVLLRRASGLSILLVVGLGSLISGLGGLLVAGDTVFDGTLWAIAISGLVLLPVSFFSLSFASRYTNASNVSLLLLLETVLGPLFVWAGAGEAPTGAMLIGGAIVVASLAAYLLSESRRRAM
ncbi:DMT family transporter [Oceaniovalibus sp. ACAM 378]|nr:DMT family transporter [Oceaniovalibus sp. ACAM 378]